MRLGRDIGLNDHSVAHRPTLPIAYKLHWLLRLGVVGCFIGHGAYGLLTKDAWVPYFGVVGIDRTWAYRLMDRRYGRRFGHDDGGRAGASRALAPDHLGPVDGSTATTFGRGGVGVFRTSRELWSTPGLFNPRRCPGSATRMVCTGVAVRDVATHRR